MAATALRRWWLVVGSVVSLLLRLRATVPPRWWVLVVVGLKLEVFAAAAGAVLVVVLLLAHGVRFAEGRILAGGDTFIRSVSTPIRPRDYLIRSSALDWSTFDGTASRLPVVLLWTVLFSLVPIKLMPRAWVGGCITGLVTLLLLVIPLILSLGWQVATPLLADHLVTGASILLPLILVASTTRGRHLSAATALRLVPSLRATPPRALGVCLSFLRMLLIFCRTAALTSLWIPRLRRRRTTALPIVLRWRPICVVVILPTVLRRRPRVDNLSLPLRIVRVVGRTDLLHVP